MPDKAHSDKLRGAILEVEAVLRKHDIAGYIVLFDNHYSEYLIYISPSWSAARFEGPAIRVRSKKADYDFDEKLQREDMELTVGMFTHFSDLTTKHAAVFQKLVGMLEEKLVVTHDKGVHTYLTVSYCAACGKRVDTEGAILCDKCAAKEVR